MHPYVIRIASIPWVEPVLLFIHQQLIVVIILTQTLASVDQ